MLTLYPRIKPNQTHQLQVDSQHTLYIEESGNPQGIPILYVHGGPGGSCSDRSRRYFDPEAYRIILFDQRGCGRSTPHGSVDNNTTVHLIEDIEKIREHLNIKQWLIFGGSWGSTLSLLYAQEHPERVSGLILRGIFLATQHDINWFLGESGIGEIFPDYWQDFTRHIDASSTKALINDYHERLFGDNEIERLNAAKKWAGFEARCATLDPNPKHVKSATDPHYALAIARIECHYFKNNCFIEEGRILNHIGRLSGTPCIIVHGRYDMICPIKNAWQLHQAWPESQLNIIRDAGHSADEPAIIDALIRATNTMSLRF
ncbi:prolyl aminopeptidase [Piscirickettsia litoralis]|uniref:Proline iminopeptidase n=1 Tax=Piscirickettsia litoralis TaxID=1891921 RepID=A0ABX3A2X2_9GAMM|nr:prolyl aminopeptidase [Piscirickettsia litoralis]ODN42855.1 prolyl aminopeptidase [Piscirickettsia litoralis]